MTRVDAHQHFWDPARGDYGWLNPSNDPLYRVFGPEQLRPLLDATGIDSTILVQAAPTESETDYLLEIAHRTPWIAGVVGWIDLDAVSAATRLCERIQQGKFVGIRPMLQDLPDSRWILAESRSASLQALSSHKLVFDALIRSNQIGVIIELAQRYPTLSIVIDHGAKPQIRHLPSESWHAAIARAAALPNIACKLSGLMTELRDGAPRSMVVRHMDALLAAFGPDRLIWGSDWPVLTQVAPYSEWIGLTEQWLTQLDPDEAGRIMGGNAERIYQWRGRA